MGARLIATYQAPKESCVNDVDFGAYRTPPRREQDQDQWRLPAAYRLARTCARARDFFNTLLEVSPGHLLQHLDVQRLVRHHPLEPAVLVLQPAQLFGIVRLHASVLVAPATEGVLADTQLFGHFGHVLAFAEQPVRFPKLAHDLLRRVLPALHSSSSLPSRAVVEPSYHVDQFSGVRSRLRRRTASRPDLAPCTAKERPLRADWPAMNSEGSRAAITRPRAIAYAAITAVELAYLLRINLPQLWPPRPSCGYRGLLDMCALDQPPSPWPLIAVAILLLLSAVAVLLRKA